MKTQSGKLILTLFFLVLVCVAGYKFERESFKSREVRLTALAHHNFAKLCLKKFQAKNETEEIRNLRHCLFVNSEFNTDKATAPIWKDKAGTAQWLFEYGQGKREKAPPMECSYRSGTLVGMLKSLGYKAHDLVIPQNVDNFNDHVVVEVLNPDTNKWEIHDPSYDVDFVSLENRSRLSLKEMLTIDKDKYEPCNFEGKCGWDWKTSEGFALEFNKLYWNIAYVRDEDTLYVTKRLDVNAKRPVYGENLSYCEWRAKWCNNIVHLD